ncbi:MAG TPA: efflux RND transporter periplasmic adaptor subunit [Pirellulales bacterium]|nr:efflux RND transporter periplasmic adaptor subunit [Pirellulales bacterium]
MIPKLLVILLASVAGGAVALSVAYQLGHLEWTADGSRETYSSNGDKNGRTTESGETAAGDRVGAPGHLEPAGGVVSINGLPGDRLEKLNVEQGKDVKKGDVLAVLESRRLRQAEYDLAKTQFDEGVDRKKAEEEYAVALRDEAELAQQQVELEQHDRDAQREKIDTLTLQQRSASEDLARLKKLRQGGNREIVADQTYEHQRLLVQKADSELAAAKDQLKKLEDSMKLAKEQADAKLRTANASKRRIPSIVQLDSLSKSVELAQRRLDMTEIKAPSKGRIEKILLREGETISQQPILQMADTETMVAVAEVYEGNALSIHVGDPASIESRALPGLLRGKVTYVGTMVARSTAAPLVPGAAPADKRAVQVRVELDRSGVADKLINLQVTVYIIPGKEARPSDGKTASGGASVADRPSSR